MSEGGHERVSRGAAAQLSEIPDAGEARAGRLSLWAREKPERTARLAQETVTALATENTEFDIGAYADVYSKVSPFSRSREDAFAISKTRLSS